MFGDKVAGIYDLYQFLNKKANNEAASYYYKERPCFGMRLWNRHYDENHCSEM